MYFELFIKLKQSTFYTFLEAPISGPLLMIIISSKQQVMEDAGLEMEQTDTLFNYTSYIYDRQINYEDCSIIVTCSASNYANVLLGTTPPSISVQLFVTCKWLPIFFTMLRYRNVGMSTSGLYKVGDYFEKTNKKSVRNIYFPHEHYIT